MSVSEADPCELLNRQHDIVLEIGSELELVETADVDLRDVLHAGACDDCRAELLEAADVDDDRERLRDVLVMVENYNQIVTELDERKPSGVGGIPCEGGR